MKAEHQYIIALMTLTEAAMRLRVSAWMQAAAFFGLTIVTRAVFVKNMPVKHMLFGLMATMVQVNETSKRCEYQGEVMNLACSLADLPNGGQILMEDKAFDGVKLHLAELTERVPRRPDWQALQMLCRYGSMHGLTSCICPALCSNGRLKLPAPVGVVLAACLFSKSLKLCESSYFVEHLRQLQL